MHNGPLHALPHVAQSVSVPSGTHPRPGQGMCPAGQHVPIAQTVPMQVIPQAPQFSLSVCRLTHSPLQHSWFDAHTTPQPPQLARSSVTPRHMPSQQS